MEPAIEDAAVCDYRTGLGDDVMNGGPGTDIADYLFGGTTGRVIADLSVGRTVGAGTDRLVEIEDLLGTRSGDDILIGDGNANVIFGGSPTGRLRVTI